MTPQLILTLNAAATAACAIGMLAARSILPAVFGLDSPLLLDTIAIAFLAYAAVLVVAARQPTVSRVTLFAFTAADVLWVVFSAVVLVLFWSQFTVLGRILVFAVACAVEVFATLQYRAAGAGGSRSAQLA